MKQIDKLVIVFIGLLIATLLSLSDLHANPKRYSYIEFARIQNKMQETQSEVRNELLAEKPNMIGVDDALNSYEAQELLHEIAQSETDSY